MDENESPEKLARQGKSLYQKGDYLGAARIYQAAQHALQKHGEEINAAEMANNASVAFLQAGKAEEAYSTAKGTPEIFAGCGDQRRQGMATGNLASAAEALGNSNEAAELYQQAADILSQAGEDQLRAAAMQSLSMLQLKTGRQLQALTTMQSGLNAVKRPSPKQSFIKKLLQIPIDMATRGKS
jgi:tetratricopeptide (TPR) repeat protein